MSCFFFYFKPMGLYLGGLIHGLMFTLVTGVGLYEDGLILGWAYPWQFTVTGMFFNGDFFLKICSWWGKSEVVNERCSGK